MRKTVITGAEAMNLVGSPKKLTGLILAMPGPEEGPKIGEVALLCNGTRLVRERQGATICFKVVGESDDVVEILHELDRGVVGLLHEDEPTGVPG